MKLQLRQHLYVEETGFHFYTILKTAEIKCYPFMHIYSMSSILIVFQMHLSRSNVLLAFQRMSFSTADDQSVLIAVQATCQPPI